jgi:hypothetical protein
VGAWQTGTILEDDSICSYGSPLAAWSRDNKTHELFFFDDEDTLVHYEREGLGSGDDWESHTIASADKVDTQGGLALAIPTISRAWERNGEKYKQIYYTSSEGKLMAAVWSPPALFFGRYWSSKEIFNTGAVNSGKISATSTGPDGTVYVFWITADEQVYRAIGQKNESFFESLTWVHKYKFDKLEPADLNGSIVCSSPGDEEIDILVCTQNDDPEELLPITELKGIRLTRFSLSDACVFTDRNEPPEKRCEAPIAILSRAKGQNELFASVGSSDGRKGFLAAGSFGIGLESR